MITQNFPLSQKTPEKNIRNPKKTKGSSKYIILQKINIRKTFKDVELGKNTIESLLLKKIPPSTILNNIVTQKEISCDYYVYTKFSWDYVNSKTVLIDSGKHKAKPKALKQFPFLYDDDGDDAGDKTSHLLRIPKFESNKGHVKNTKSMQSAYTRLTSKAVNYYHKKLHQRCLTRPQIRF